MFGCIFFAKTDTVGIKKLDDRSRMLVHLGTEPGSKAYRLYDPLTKKIVVSRALSLMKVKVGTGQKVVQSKAMEVNLSRSL